MTPALAEVHGVTWRARGINPAHFIIHFFFFIPYGLMASQKASDLAVNAYDDSCIVVANSRREQPADNTCRPIKAPDSSRGYRFRPLKLPIRAPKITALPQEPLLLFQKFVPISLVESWACYTNSWASHVLEEARCGRRTLKPQSRLFQWKSTSAAEIYIWIAIFIYMRLHTDKQIKDYWKASPLGKQRPLHPITKWMTYTRVQLLSRNLRLFDHTTIDKEASIEDYSRTFIRVRAWSDHIQQASLDFYTPGTSIAIDECMVRFLGRDLETTVVPNKPIPRGFKAWAVAQEGYFLRWLWHRPHRKYGPVGVRPAYRRKSPQVRKQRQRRPARKSERAEHLNPTQAVVVAQ
jgi:hypothetical protein